MNKPILDFLFLDSERVNRFIDLSNLAGKTITISGATGLLGMNLILTMIYYNNHTLEKKIRINALSLNTPPNFFAEIFKIPEVSLICGDITDEKFINKIPKSEFIIHCAGYGQPLRFIEDKLKTIMINTSSLIALSKRLIRRGRLLYISTSEVYSGCKALINVETDIGNTDPYHPRACYIESKKTGEVIINSLRSLGINAFSARLALAYGPGVKLDDKRVINQLIVKGLKQGEIKLLDDGLTVRTYCYISNAIEILLNILLNGSQPVYNVGGQSKTSIKNLAEMIGKLLRVNIKFSNQTSILKEAPDIVALNLDRVKNEFKLSPFINFDEGLYRTVKWLKLINKFYV